MIEGVDDRPSWHAALAWALLGAVPDDLPEPGRVDLPALVAELERQCGGPVALRHRVAEQGGAGHRVPEELMRGLGAAQFTAARRALERLLSPDSDSAATVAADRTLTADERRLLADVPPHHLG